MSGISTYAETGLIEDDEVQGVRKLYGVAGEPLVTMKGQPAGGHVAFGSAQVLPKSARWTPALAGNRANNPSFDYAMAWIDGTNSTDTVRIAVASDNDVNGQLQVGTDYVVFPTSYGVAHSQKKLDLAVSPNERIGLAWVGYDRKVRFSSTTNKGASFYQPFEFSTEAIGGGSVDYDEVNNRWIVVYVLDGTWTGDKYRIAVSADYFNYPAVKDGNQALKSRTGYGIALNRRTGDVRVLSHSY